MTTMERAQGQEPHGGKPTERAAEHPALDLPRADELFRAFSELASDYYAYSLEVFEDGTLEWEWVSDSYERVTGFTPEESSERGGWQTLLHPDDLPGARDSFVRVLAGESTISELRIMTKSGDERHLRTYAHPVWDEQEGRVVRIFGAVHDITERKRAEQRLQETNSLLRATLDATADGILVVNADGEMVAFNQKFVAMWGLPEEVVASRADDRALEVVLDQLKDPSEFLDKVRALYEAPEETSLDVLEFQDGRIFERYSQPQRVGADIVGRVWSFRDVTEQKRGEQKIRDALDALRRADRERRDLLSHLVRAKEEERHRVAAEIHDDSVQIMTSVAIGIERVARQAPDPAQRDTLTRLEDSARAAIARLRAMVFELKPPALDEEGLRTALSMYLEELQVDTGIAYEFDNRLDGEPPGELRVVLYRIAKEALTNVRKHSGARRVSVDLAHADGGITVRISDDGVGFDGDGADVPGHIGIAEMRQRAEMAGGSLTITSTRPRGTVVEVWVPEDGGGMA